MRPLIVDNSAEAAIARLGVDQFGIVTRVQMEAHGINQGMVRTRVRRGSLQPLYPGTFLIGGAPPSWEARLLSAQFSLGCRAAVSHRSNAAYLGLEGFDRGPLELTLGGDAKKHLNGIKLHRSRILTASDVRKSGPFVLTKPERLMIELGAVASPRMLEVALDSILFKGLSTYQRVATYLAETRARGLNGVTALSELLESRDPLQQPGQSIFETDFYRMLKASPWCDADFQFKVFDEEGFVARLDVAYPVKKIGIEAQSLRYHSPRERMKRDAARHNRLSAAGWRVLYETYEDLLNSPDAVLGRLEKLMDAAI